MLVEPSIIYQEVCGTLARKIDLETANIAKEQLDLLIEQKRLINCDKKTCISAFRLCAEYGIYAIDALYLNVALSNYAVLVSLDKEFIDKLNDRLPIEAFTVDNYPY
jgi:predicted nucleic acid-binding protein